MANIGKSITINGDVSGDEDLIIEGRVDGRVDLQNHHLTVGPNGEIRAEVHARQVTIIGRVAGNVVATERAEIEQHGRLDGDLQAPVLVIQEGALVNGSLSMKGTASLVSAEDKPAASATASAPSAKAAPRAAAADPKSRPTAPEASA